MPRTQIDGSQIKSGSINQDIFGSQIINSGDISDDAILNSHISSLAAINASKILVSDPNNYYTGLKDLETIISNIAINNNSKANSSDMSTALGLKVDKILGKSLSTNDFTDTFKNKLDGITENANKVESSLLNGNIKINSIETTVYTHPLNHSPEIITQDINNRFVSDIQISDWNNKQNNLGYTPVPDTRTVNGKALSSNISISASDVGLNNVDNTNDIDKPVSNLTSTAISTEASIRESNDIIISTEISNEINIRISTDTLLNNILSTETSSRISSDLIISDAISSEASIRASNDLGLAINISTVMSSNITTESSIRESVDTIISNALFTEISNRISADLLFSTIYSNEISTENSLRLSTDNILFNNISTEVSIRESVDNLLSAAMFTAVDSGISVEISTRLSADVVLSTNLSTEVSIRESADLAASTACSTEISTEVSIRESADAAMTLQKVYDNSTDGTIKLATGKVFKVEDNNDTTYFQCDPDGNNPVNISMTGPVNVSGNMNITGELYVSGSVTRIDSIITDSDHILLAPHSASTTALEIRPSAAVTLTSPIVDLYIAQAGSSVFKITEAGATEVNGNFSIIGSHTVDVGSNKIINVTNGSDAQDAVAYNQLSTEASIRASADAVLSTNLSTEASIRESTDTILINNISTELSTRASVDIELSTNISIGLSTEISIREFTDTIISNSLSTEASIRASADASLSTTISTNMSSDVTTEASIRLSVDTVLTNNLSTEISTRTSVDIAVSLATSTSISILISTEISSRISNDIILTNNLSTEVSSRISGDIKLSTDLSTEVSTRSATISTEASTRASIDIILSTAISTEISTRTSVDATMKRVIVGSTNFAGNGASVEITGTFGTTYTVSITPTGTIDGTIGEYSVIKNNNFFEVINTGVATTIFDYIIFY